jgi:hypothetical protein
VGAVLEMSEGSHSRTAAVKMVIVRLLPTQGGHRGWWELGKEILVDRPGWSVRVAGGADRTKLRMKDEQCVGKGRKIKRGVRSEGRQLWSGVVYVPAWRERWSVKIIDGAHG